MLTAPLSKWEGKMGRVGETGAADKECMRWGRSLPKLAAAAGGIPGHKQHKV
jgi:hypothetical protein